MKHKLRKFLSKLTSDRRGAALEMALMLLVVTFALSTLILTTSLLQHNKKVRTEDAMNENILLEQIGQDFCTAILQGTDDSWKDRYPDYLITIEDTTLTVCDKETDAILLNVVLTATGSGSYTITKWNKN